MNATVSTTSPATVARQAAHDHIVAALDAILAGATGQHGTVVTFRREVGDDRAADEYAVLHIVTGLVLAGNMIKWFGTNPPGNTRKDTAAYLQRGARWDSLPRLKRTADVRLAQQGDSTQLEDRVAGWAEELEAEGFTIWDHPFTTTAHTAEYVELNPSTKKGMRDYLGRNDDLLSVWAEHYNYPA